MRFVKTGCTALLALILIGTALIVAGHAIASTGTKKKIFIVSSYHRTYLWSQSTQKGLGEAMLEYGYLDTSVQARELAENDYVESSQAIVRKFWMDTKRNNSPTAVAKVTINIISEINKHQPDLVFVGDDNAANYIGGQLLDTTIPVVFWGINGLPMKYGLVDSMDTPGHNVTGVWQSGYHKQSLELLHLLVPDARTFAVIGCDSVSSRPVAKQLEALSSAGQLPLDLVEVVLTNSFSEYKDRVLELADRVDAFFIVNHDTLRDDRGEYVDMLTVGNWYLTTIQKPEASHEGQFVREGMLLAASDSGYNQSYLAFEIAYDILEQGISPSRIRTRTPKHGPLMVNRLRAETLGIRLDAHAHLIDEIVDEALALSD